MISVTVCEDIISNLNENSKKTQIDKTDPWMYNFNTEVRKLHLSLFFFSNECLGKVRIGRNSGKNSRKESEGMS